jgi:hypothetical protein
VTRLQADNLGFEFQQGQEIYPFSKTSRQAVVPTHPPIQWGLGTLSTHLHPVPRLIMGGSIPPLPIYDPMACIEMTIFLLSVYLLKNYRIYCSILIRVHMFRLF